MHKFLLIFFLNLIPLGAIAQMKTPFVTYDFKNDTQYNSRLNVFQKAEVKGETATTKSIATWAYQHKDWETAIDYFEKLIVDYPTAENFFKLGVAAARKSLEVSRFFSVPYVVKARKSVLKAHELEPSRVVYLNLLIQLYAEIPTILGGNMTFAQRKAKDLTLIDPIEGMLMEAYLFQLNNETEAAINQYRELFRTLKTDIKKLKNGFLSFRRDLIFELGRAAAEYQLESEMGIAALDYYILDFSDEDNYPLEWAYYYRSKIYFYNDKLEKAQASLEQALKIKPDFEEGLTFLKVIKLE